MADQQDIRWLQRFDNFQRAIKRLQDGVDLSASRSLSDLEQQGMIQGFEFTHELAWNTLKDFLTYRGVSDIIGSRDATRAAFKVGIITNGEVWMDMIKSRNLTSHTYREEIAQQIGDKIIQSYFHEFKVLQQTLKQWQADHKDGC